MIFCLFLFADTLIEITYGPYVRNSNIFCDEEQICFKSNFISTIHNRQGNPPIFLNVGMFWLIFSKFILQSEEPSERKMKVNIKKGTIKKKKKQVKKYDRAKSTISVWKIRKPNMIGTIEIIVAEDRFNWYKIKENQRSDKGSFRF